MKTILMTLLLSAPFAHAVEFDQGVSASDFVYLYSMFGETEESGAGFEEWRALTQVSMIPEPGTAALLALGLLPLTLGGRRRWRAAWQSRSPPSRSVF